jgi:hypothetical protein
MALPSRYCFAFFHGLLIVLTVKGGSGPRDVAVVAMI